MKNKFLFFAVLVLILALAGGYWAAKSRIPPAGTKNAAKIEGTRQTGDFRQGNLSPAPGSGSLPGRAALEGKPKLRRTPPKPQGSHGEARAYNLADPQGRLEFAEAMKQEGASERDIQQVLKEAAEAAEKAKLQEKKGGPSSEEATPPPPANQDKARVFNLADPQGRLEFADAMREDGASEEETQQVLKEAAEAAEKAKLQEKKEVPSSKEAPPSPQLQKEAIGD